MKNLLRKSLATGFIALVLAISGFSLHSNGADPNSSAHQAYASSDCESENLGESCVDLGDAFNLDPRKEGEEQSSYLESENPIIAFVLQIIEFATLLAGSVAIIIFIIGGFVLMLSRGNQQSLDKGKDILRYGVIGLIVTFMSYIIVVSIESFFEPETLPPQTTVIQ